MPFAGKLPTILRLDEQKDVGVRESGHLHRRFHEDGGERRFHVLELRHQTHQTLSGSHGFIHGNFCPFELLPNVFFFRQPMNKCASISDKVVVSVYMNI